MPDGGQEKAAIAALTPFLEGGEAQAAAVVRVVLRQVQPQIEYGGQWVTPNDLIRALQGEVAAHRKTLRELQEARTLIAALRVEDA
jgi:hypothetical protein